MNIFYYERIVLAEQKRKLERKSEISNKLLRSDNFKLKNTQSVIKNVFSTTTK